MTMSNDVSNMAFHFTGDFENSLPRPRDAARKAGATVLNSISKVVNFVVKGRCPSTIRLEKANELGIEILDQQQFWEMVEPKVWEDCEQRKAEAAEEQKRRWAEAEKRQKEEEERKRIKRETMPHTRIVADILSEDECYAHLGNVRIIEGEEYKSLTADQLREAICDGENHPVVLRDENGAFHLICAEYRGNWSIDYQPEEKEIDLYEDGTFELVYEEEEDEEEDEGA
jgi:hypothetical protein